jgi:hypothetical protein
MSSDGSGWIVAIASVEFDTDVGQRLESLYPEGALSEQEEKDVAFHSFPVRLPEGLSWGLCILWISTECDASHKHLIVVKRLSQEA